MVGAWTLLQRRHCACLVYNALCCMQKLVPVFRL
jgi:hypothetical protein